MTPSRPLFRSIPLILPLGLGLALLGCATNPASEEQPESGASGEFPVSISHSFGETVVEEIPERVATVGGWPNAEVALALDVVPVGMPRADYGDDNGNGILPWTEEQLTKLGGDEPALFDETDGIDFEAVSDTEPDVILAATSGITEEEYETLSKIAPVVAYPDVAWATSWQDNIRLNSAALGLEAEGQELVASLEQDISAAVAAHPGLRGANAAFINVVPSDTSAISVATTVDARASYLRDLGLGTPELVKEESDSAEAFFFDVSAEKIDLLDDVDILLGYTASDTELIDALRSDKLLKLMPAAQNSAVVSIPDNTPMAAALTPSPLGIPWSIDELAGELGQAAKRIN